jgi:hypothetical protein
VRTVPLSSVVCRCCWQHVLGDVRERAWIDTKVIMWDDDESGDYADETIRSVISERLELAMGLVNRGKRHPTGHPWYGPSKRTSASQRRLTIRLPAVVTCWCGNDELVPAHPSIASYATSDPEVRRDLAFDELADRGED